MKCKHDWKNYDNNLIGIPKLKMVVPTTYTLQCQCCGKIITVSQAEIINLKEFLQHYFS
jgi:hypothetical protein